MEKAHAQTGMYNYRKKTMHILNMVAVVKLSTFDCRQGSYIRMEREVVFHCLAREKEETKKEARFSVKRIHWR